MVRGFSQDRVNWISERTKYKPMVVKTVLEANQEYSNNHKRQPKPPVPEGYITLSEAEGKYGISTGTLSRWADKGRVRPLSPDKKRGQKRYVLETDVTKMLEIYQQDPGRGKWTVKKALGEGNNS